LVDNRFYDALDKALYISDDLRRKPYKGDPGLYTGHCYIVSEVIYHLAGGWGTGWKPMFVYVNGYPHWFLKHEDGMILDHTAGQFGKTPIPYDKARGKGFLTKRLSKRASILLERTRALYV
jgi:hypothetical protein